MPHEHELPTLGQRFRDRYFILEELGRGGMGVVHKANDTKLNQVVAIKFVLPSLVNDEETLKRFQRETTLGINHANIIRVLDWDLDPWPFMVLELAEGGTLADRIARNGAVALEEFLIIAPQLVSALIALHVNKSIYRDLKTSNIGFTSDSTAKLLDLGLVRRIDDSSELTTEGSVIGTIGGMSPEQAAGKKLDAQSDVFALGVVFVEMLTGKRFFSSKSLEELLIELPEAQALARERLAHEVRLRPIQQIVDKMLSSDPNARPTPHEVGRALKATERRDAAPVQPLPTDGISGSSVLGESKTVTVPLRKRPATWTVAVGAAVALVAGGLGYQSYRRKAEREREAAAVKADQARLARAKAEEDRQEAAKNAEHERLLAKMHADSERALAAGKLADFPEGWFWLGVPPDSVASVTAQFEHGWIREADPLADSYRHVFVKHILVRTIETVWLEIVNWLNELLERKQIVVTRDASSHEYRYVRDLTGHRLLDFSLGYIAYDDQLQRFRLASQKFAYHPASGISFRAATDFCTFYGGRLPTDDEHERVARDGTNNDFPWGNRPRPSCARFDYDRDPGADRRANHPDKAQCARFQSEPPTVDVGAYTPDQTKKGVRHLFDNVREWVSDACDDPSGSNTESHRVRGSGFETHWEFGQTSFRSCERAYDDVGEDAVYSGIGFRCVYDPK